MKNKLKSVFLVIAALPAIAFALPPPAYAEFNPLDKACQAAPDSPVCKDAAAQGTKNPIAGPDGIIAKAANLIALIAGIGAVIMIIIGGFEFITAGGSPIGQRSGDPNKAKQARSRIISAVIGLAVIALAWALVRLITDKVLR